MRVTYPKIEGATPIIGFVDSDHNFFNIHPGESIEMSETSAKEIRVTFKFLVIGEKQEIEIASPGLANVTKEVIEEKTETGIAKFQRLKKEAQASGIDIKGMKLADLEQAINGD